MSDRILPLPSLSAETMGGAPRCATHALVLPNEAAVELTLAGQPRLTDAERRRLAEIAREAGVGRAAALRRLVEDGAQDFLPTSPHYAPIEQRRDR